MSLFIQLPFTLLLWLSPSYCSTLYEQEFRRGEQLVEKLAKILLVLCSLFMLIGLVYMLFFAS
ncbi:MAG: hypothetical protein Q8898_10265 [Bacillota bacterium]|nr:hypothetical protein [Bacillota bacterium]